MLLSNPEAKVNAYLSCGKWPEALNVAKVENSRTLYTVIYNASKAKNNKSVQKQCEKILAVKK